MPQWSFILLLGSSLVAATGTAGFDAASAEAASRDLKERFEGQPYPVVGSDLSPQDRDNNLALALRAKQLHGSGIEFIKSFPQSEHVPFAKKVIVHSLATMVLAGDQSVAAQLKSTVAEFKSDPRLSYEAKLDFTWTALKAFHPDRSTAAHERGIWELIREFPNDEASWMIAMSVAQARGAAGRSLAEEILANEKTPPETKETARGFLKRISLLGSTLKLTFEASDGRSVDFAKLQGKVILIDFWATWCGPCIAEVPKLKELYEKFHSLGFEIVGVSFDTDRKAFAGFLRDNDIKWPQYFDGKGWKNVIGSEYGISAIPQMWLISRQGKVVDLNARGDLESKVASLVDRPEVSKELKN